MKMILLIFEVFTGVTFLSIIFLISQPYDFYLIRLFRYVCLSYLNILFISRGLCIQVPFTFFLFVCLFS